jgi:hypothetical protein
MISSRKTNRAIHHTMPSTDVALGLLKADAIRKSTTSATAR